MYVCTYDFVKELCKPDYLFEDCLTRRWKGGKALALDMISNQKVHIPTDLDLYIAGFPCTPFSRRHANSKCFDEDAAQVCRA